MAGFTAETVELIQTRDRGECVRCGGTIRGERGRAWSIHHRCPRSMGGTNRVWVNQAANGVLLCGSGTTGCHGWIERNRQAAFDAGFLVSAMGFATAETTVIRHAAHGLVLLDNDGGWVPAGDYGKEWGEVL